MSPPPSPQSVLIVGGSLASLMHALPLLELPHPPQIRILERSATNLLHNQGAGVVASPELQHFFADYVRPGRDIAVTSPRRHYLDREGRILEHSVEDRPQRMTSWDLLYHLLRWRVDGTQSAYVVGLATDSAQPKASYEHGCTVTAVEDAGSDGVRLSWTRQGSGESETATADLVVAADGASSTLRRMLLPSVRREYVGYVAWRGTCAETTLSEGAGWVLRERFTFFHAEGMQILGYLIPGEGGTLEEGKRLFNWVWYCNYAEGSQELEELMTDVGGRKHAVTLPVGGMRPQVWERQKAFAREVLPPQFAEAVEKTREPFVQAVTDVISPKNSFMDGKMLLVGDALAGFRPHTAASTGQAAFDASMLGQWVRGEIGREDYDGKVMEFAERVQKQGVMLGERSQFGKHPLAG